MRSWLILLLAACGARPPSAAAPLALPGACVDATADAAARLEEVTAPLGEAPYAQAAPDLDGDGAADRMFSAGAGVTTNTLLYVARGACAHFVGDVRQAPAAQATRHHGLADLQVEDSSGCEGARCACEPDTLVFRFDGVGYVLDEPASTHRASACPEE